MRIRWYVYSLEDQAGAVRYVGKSSNPAQRFRHHVSPSATSYMRAWVQSLVPGAPVLRILHKCEDETSALVAEAEQIARFRAEGCVLINRTDGGERTCTRAESKFRGIGERVRFLREATGMTQKKFSQLCGVAQPTISRLEGGKHEGVTAEVAVLVARALGTTVEYLVTGEGSSAERAA